MALNITEQPLSEQSLSIGDTAVYGVTVENPAINGGCEVGDTFYLGGTGTDPFLQEDIDEFYNNSLLTVEPNVVTIKKGSTGSGTEGRFSIVEESFYHVEVQTSFIIKYNYNSRLYIEGGVFQVANTSITLVNGTTIPYNPNGQMVHVDVKIVQDGLNIICTGTVTTESDGVVYDVSATRVKPDTSPQVFNVVVKAYSEMQIHYFRQVGDGLPNDCTGLTSTITYNLLKDDIPTGDTITTDQLSHEFQKTDVRESDSGTYTIEVFDTVETVVSDDAVLIVSVSEYIKTITWGNGGNYPTLFEAWRSIPDTGLEFDTLFLQVGDSTEIVTESSSPDNVTLGSILSDSDGTVSQEKLDAGFRPTNGYDIYVRSDGNFTTTISENILTLQSWLVFANYNVRSDTNIYIESLIVSTDYSLCNVTNMNEAYFTNNIGRQLDAGAGNGIIDFTLNGGVYIKNNDLTSVMKTKRVEDWGTAYLASNDTLVFEDSIVRTTNLNNCVSFLDYDGVDSDVSLKRLYFISDDATRFERQDDEYGGVSPIDSAMLNNEVFTSFSDNTVLEAHTEIPFDITEFLSIDPVSGYYSVPNMCSILTADASYSTDISSIDTDILGRLINYYSVGAYTNKDSKVSSVLYGIGVGSQGFGTVLSEASVDLFESIEYANITNEIGPEEAVSTGFGNFTNEDSVENGISLGFAWLDNFAYDVSYSDSIPMGTVGIYTPDILSAINTGFGNVQTYFDSVTNMENIAFGNAISLFSTRTDAIKFFDHIPEEGVYITVDRSVGLGTLRATFGAFLGDV